MYVFLWSITSRIWGVTKLISEHGLEVDDSTLILHQETGLMSKVIRAHRWIDVSKSQGAAEGPGRSISVKKTTKQ